MAKDCGRSTLGQCMPRHRMRISHRRERRRGAEQLMCRLRGRAIGSLDALIGASVSLLQRTDGDETNANTHDTSHPPRVSAASPRPKHPTYITIALTAAEVGS